MRRSQITRAVRNFEAAVREHEVKGAQPPEEIPRIEREYALCKKRLYDMIDAIIKYHLQENRDES